MSNNFQLYPKLAQDTFFIKDLNLSRLLLMNDKRFPWLILVPRINGLIELFDLSKSDQIQLLEEINTVAQYCYENFNADKMNIATLGNIVSQLHIHIIARNKSDVAWPASVFGFGQGAPYSEIEREALLKKLECINNII